MKIRPLLRDNRYRVTGWIEEDINKKDRRG